jgi:hypothetical protein
MSATTPQHHLIINILPAPLSSAASLEDILLAYDVTEGDIEPAVLALARRQGTDGMHRAARLAAANRALRQHGYNPLLMMAEEQQLAQGPLQDGMKLIEERPLFKDELCSMAAVGINEAEYRAIKGTAGIAMGLHLDRLAYSKIRGICKKDRPQELVLRYARMRL